MNHNKFLDKPIRPRQVRPTWWLFLGLLIAILPVPSASAQTAVELLHAWEVEPALPGEWMPEEEGVRPALNPQRLASDLLQTCVDEAQRCVLLADDPQIQGKRPSLNAIMQRLSDGQDNLQVRQALVSAAIALSDGAEAEELWAAAQFDKGSKAAVEWALIQWRSPVALEVWRRQVDSDVELSAELLSAVDGIAATGDSGDRDRLQTLLLRESLPLGLQWAVARALGAVVNDGLEPLATQLVSSNRTQAALLAAELLQTHSSLEAKQLLLEILQGETGPAQMVAFGRVCELEPAEARQLAKGLLDHPDSNMRMQATRILSDGEDEFSLRSIGYALRDRNPRIRRTARETLRRRAVEVNSQAFVNEAIAYYLSGDSVEGAEQAIVLSVELGREQSCRQLVALLSHPDPRVNVRAGWALQELATKPEILNACLPFAEAVTEGLELGNQRVEQADVSRTAFLFGAFGRNAFRPASDMLLKYVPKDGQKMNTHTRAAAIWALGFVFADQENTELASALAQRLLDNTPNEPEDPIVKYASAIALGRMRNATSPPQLSSTPEQIPLPIGYAVDWALKQFEQ